MNNIGEPNIRPKTLVMDGAAFSARANFNKHKTDSSSVVKTFNSKVKVRQSTIPNNSSSSVPISHKAHALQMSSPVA